MSLLAVDISDAMARERALAQANAQLAESLETPVDVVELVQSLADTLAADGGEGLEAWDPYLVIQLQRAALGAERALAYDEPQRRNELRVRLEQMRQVFRDAAAAEPVSDQRSPKEIAQWLEETVRVPQQRLADLLGVDRRTYQRWVSPGASSQPSGADEHRLRVVARLVNHLRHALTPIGVIGWFERERLELDGRAPRDLLNEPDALPRLEALARGTRSQIAA